MGKKFIASIGVASCSQEIVDGHILAMQQRNSLYKLGKAMGKRGIVIGAAKFCRQH